MTNLTETIVRGLAAGDTSSSMNADFHIYSLPPKRVNRLRILNKLADDTRTTNVSRPFAHANPPALLHPAPGEALEWFTFSLRQQQNSSDDKDRLAAWLELAELDPPIRTRIGTRNALLNLKKGLTPAQAGNDNPHYFDDLAMVRVLAAVAAFPQDSQAALDAATADAEFTTALDGLWCAQATARLFSRLAEGASPREAVRAAVELLPTETWSRRIAETSLKVAAATSGPIERARRLSIDVGDWIYSYPTTAPETLGFLLAHVASARNADDLLLGALSQPRNGASLPALAGAAAAVMYGTDWIPADLTLDTITLKGIAIPQYQGQHVTDGVTVNA
jgi:ADP-ribosylglycohydrolase